MYLADDSISLETRINEVVNHGRPYHVHGIGRNVATKVLAMLHPMPVYNQAVEETLRDFGYVTDSQTTTGTEVLLSDANPHCVLAARNGGAQRNCESPIDNLRRP